MELERMTDAGNTMEVFENDIDLYLHEFAERDGIDFKTVGQSVWNSALRYVYNHVFKPNPKILKSNANINTTGNNIPSNYNAYDYQLLNDICDYYIYNMCMRYNKEVSIVGFTTLTGIDESTIYDWGNNSTKLSKSSNNIYKKLTKMREESLSNKLADGKQNPVGVIAMLNRHYGWSSPYVSDSSKSRKTLTDAELPRLGENTPMIAVNDTKNDEIL